jgi:hypothetical protein
LPEFILFALLLWPANVGMKAPLQFLTRFSQPPCISNHCRAPMDYHALVELLTLWPAVLDGFNILGFELTTCMAATSTNSLTCWLGHQ